MKEEDFLTIQTMIPDPEDVGRHLIEGEILYIRKEVINVIKHKHIMSIKDFSPKDIWVLIGNGFSYTVKECPFK
jgi:hypothetical protein